MSIDSIGSRQYLIATLGVLDPNSTDETSSDPMLASTSTSSSTSAIPSMLDTSSDSDSSGLKTNFSTAASLLSTLSQLQKQDPTAFKKATSEISDSLYKAGEESTDATQSYTLNSLAAKFSNASVTGSLTAATPSKTGNTLRGYGGSSGNLVSSFLSQNLSTDLSSAVNTMIAGKISSVLSDD